MNQDAPSGKLHLLAAIERERRRLGDDLHDTLCQTLAGTTLLLDKIERCSSVGKPILPETFDALKGLLVTAVAQARALARRYSPEPLEGAALLTALQQLAADLQNVHANVASEGKLDLVCEFICEKPVFVQSGATAQALFRIAEQALESAVRSGKARRVLLRLEPRDAAAVLTIEHDGKPFFSSSPDAAFSGLEFMRAHAESVGGTIHYSDENSSGARITAILPL